MAFNKSFNKNINKSSASSSPISIDKSYEPSMAKSMTAYLPTYKAENLYGQSQEAGFEYKLPSSMLRKMYERNVVVRAAIDTIINEVVSANWVIKPVKEDVELDEGKKKEQQEAIDKITNFLHHPNENRESFRYVLEKMMWDLLIYDAGVLEKVRNMGGDKLKELYAIPGDTIKIKVDEHGKLLGYWQVIPGSKWQPKFFGPDDLTYIIMNPRSHTPYGFSPLHTLENMVTAFLYSEHYNIKYFENNATPRGILEVGTMNETQLDRFREYWRQEHIQQPHRVMVLSNPYAHEGKGGVKWVPLAMSSKDMELMQYLNWLMKMILMVFGVTPSEVGWTEDTARAPGMGQMLQSQAFKNKAIYPMMQRISTFLTEEVILEEFDRKDLKFEFVEEQSAQDKLIKAQLDTLLVNAGIMTVDEIRKERGLKPQQEMGGMGGPGGGGLDDILRGLQGKGPEEDFGTESALNIENTSKEPNVVDLAFNQIKTAVYDHLGLNDEAAKNPKFQDAMTNAYNELKNSIMDYVGKNKKGETGSLIKNAFNNLVKEIKLLTSMKTIDNILGGGQ